MSKQVRVTVSMDAEALAVYKRMATAGGLSVSRCLGEWLGDTSDAALMIAGKMEEAKAAPKRVLNEMLAMTTGLHDELLTLRSDVRAKGWEGVGRPAGSPPLTPPYSNTGVKVPRKGGKRG